MSEIQSYRDLIVWQRAMKLVYRFTTTHLREEIYGLTSQLRRAAVSVPANIAEGTGRENTVSFI
jgi:four helix bundle protein